MVMLMLLRCQTIVSLLQQLHMYWTQEHRQQDRGIYDLMLYHLVQEQAQIYMCL